MRPSVWITKRKAKQGNRYGVRWVEASSGIVRNKTFKRLEDARLCQVKIRRDIETNDYHAPIRLDYGAWVKQHLENMRNSPDIDVSPKTIACHREALSALGRVCKPKSPLEITPRMIRDFRRKLLDENLSPFTVNKHIRIIRSALSYAVRDEINPVNKLLGQHRLCLKTEQQKVRVLEVGEVVALMNVAIDPMQKLVISLAYYHGLRRGEICYLQWQDVDLEDYRLSVIDREGARTKTRRSRTIALRRETAELLSKLAPDRTCEFVFTKPHEFYWSCGKWFSKLVEQPGLDPCTLHDLRKTCNTLMMDAPGPQGTLLCRYWGTQRSKVSERYYTGALMEQQRRAVDSLPSIG